MTMRRAIAALIAGVALAVAGCGDPSPTTPALPPPVARAWAGTFGGGNEPGCVVVDLVQFGDSLAGDVAYWSAPLAAVRAAPARQRVSGGAAGDSIDIAAIADPAAFRLRGEVYGLGGLRGTLVLGAPMPLQAAVTCNAVVRGQGTIEGRIRVEAAGKALAFDGTRFWVSTAGDDHLLVDPQGGVVGSVPVFVRPNTHWTSDALAFDGRWMWGHLPVTVIEPGGARNTSRLYAFDSQGAIRDSLEIAHRTSGLAWFGAALWSLDAATHRVLRLDAAGQVTASIALQVPDPIHLESDGVRFWTTGWLLPRLYALAIDGRVAGLFDLPEPTSFPGGLAAEGSSMWCARTDFFPPYATRLYRLAPGLP